jgi:hypothetical protein
MTQLKLFVVADHEPQTRPRNNGRKARAVANGYGDLDTTGGIVRFGFEKASGETGFAGGIARFTLGSREQ